MTETQTTLARTISFAGVGLHTGCRVNLSILPAPPDTGLVFRRTDLGGFPLPAQGQYVANVNHATTLMRHGVTLSTVEHVLSALYGMGIANAFIDLDELEAPILDGSALPYVEGIESVGVVEQDAPRMVLRLLSTIHHELGDKLIRAEPSDSFQVSYGIEFPHPLIGRQELSATLSPSFYARELASSRTFGFARDFEKLKEIGLIKGGSLENALALTEDGLLNPEGLRFPDEFVRHKTMDFVGDIALLGCAVLGSFRAWKAGHGIHAAMVKKILSDPSHYEKVPATQVLTA